MKILDIQDVADALVAKQALTDPDTINRYFAYKACSEKEKIRVIEALLADSDKQHQASLKVSPDFVKLHYSILFDQHVTPATRAQILQEEESVISREGCFFYCFFFGVNLSPCFVCLCFFFKYI